MCSFPNLEPVLFSIFSINCCFLTCLQVLQEAGKVVWYSHVLKNYPVCCDPHKGFNVVNEADFFFLEFPCFLYDPQDVGNLISGSPAFSNASLHIWKFSVCLLLKCALKDFEHYLASMWNEHNCMVVWTVFDIDLLRDWNENWPFPVLWPPLSFPNLLVYWVQHFNSIVF